MSDLKEIVERWYKSHWETSLVREEGQPDYYRGYAKGVKDTLTRFKEEVLNKLPENAP